MANDNDAASKGKGKGKDKGKSKDTSKDGGLIEKVLALVEERDGKMSKEKEQSYRQLRRHQLEGHIVKEPWRSDGQS